MPETTKLTGGTSGGNQGDGALSANTILLTRYKILGVLGGGGMGTVYQARDLNFPDVRKLVAIKEMHNQATDRALRESTLNTFRREANILATLSHPAIPRIFDFFDRDDRAYLVMEFINGSDLEMLLTKTKALPVEKVIEWAIDLCDVLDYLHNHQPDTIIFRDMKPSNIMIDSLGKVRLIDFGIAKTFVSGVKHTMIGTEGYSAPEQYKGDVTPQSDMYSLGATLHHVLTRKDPRLEPPFSFHERPIQSFNPDVPDELVQIVEKALAFSPADRYSNCAEMGDAMKRLLYGKGPISVSAAGSDAKDDGDAWDLAGGIQPRWVFKTEDEIRSSPSVHNGVIYIGSYDHNVWALDGGSGELVWKFATEGGIAASPVVDPSSGLVLFGSEDFTFNAVDAKTGRIAWSYTTKDRIRGTATLAMDHIFFGSDDGHLYALAGANGRNLWSSNLGSPIRSKPFVTDDLIISGCDTGEVVALTFSGEQKWVYRTRRSVISSPYVDQDENLCYVGSYDGFLYALDAGSGYSSWRFRTTGPIISSPVKHNDLLFFGSVDGNLYAINAITSREKWRFSTEEAIVGSAVVHRDAVYFGGTDGNFYCLELRNGKERWRFETDAPITSTPCIAGDTIYFGSLDQTLYALPLIE